FRLDGSIRPISARLRALAGNPGRFALPGLRYSDVEERRGNTDLKLITRSRTSAYGMVRPWSYLAAQYAVSAPKRRRTACLEIRPYNELSSLGGARCHAKTSTNFLPNRWIHRIFGARLCKSLKRRRPDLSDPAAVWWLRYRRWPSLETLPTLRRAPSLPLSHERASHFYVN